MADLAEIDRSGRLKLPTEVMGRHRLSHGSRFRVVEEGARIVLEPVDRGAGPQLLERNGLLIVSGTLEGAVPDHREVREEREQSWIDPDS